MNDRPERTTVLTPVVVSRDSGADDLRHLIAGWLAGYNKGSRRNYKSIIVDWLDWCRSQHIDALQVDREQPTCVRRAHVEMYGRILAEQRHNMPSTVAHKLSTLRSFYRWLFLEDVIDKDPCAHVRRPRLDDLVSRPYLDRMELGRFIAIAEGGSARDYALCTLLALNGLRISEALNANIETISHERGHHTLVIMGKGNKPATVPLSPRVHRALMAYIGERTHGPIFLGREGSRMERTAAARIIRRIAKKAGVVDKRISPHSLRRSFITCSLDAGVPLRDVQHSARHSDPRVTSRYDQNRSNLDSHATYVLTAFVAGS